jgi:hypothetical protein
MIHLVYNLFVQSGLGKLIFFYIIYGKLEILFVVESWYGVKQM